jgi:hypothetical protein
MFDDLTTDRLERRIAEMAGEIAALTCRWLLHVAEFDRRRGYEQWGHWSCSRWLSWRCSVSPRAAREHVRVARRLTELPLVRKAFAAGELSYSKVRAVTRVEDPELEQHLFYLARHATAAQLERLVRAYRGVMSVEDARDAHARRYFDHVWEDDGTLSFRGRLAAEEGALLLRSIAAGRDALNESAFRAAQGGSAEPPRPAARPRNVDAHVAVAESMLANGAAPSPGAERHQVVVHVDADVLAADAGGAGKRCETADGAALSAETARRLSCDASIVAMLDGADGAVNVGRKTRAIPPATRRALADRDRGCRFPGCTNHRFVDGHHIRHWSAGGRTDLDNLVQLCRRHHRLVHEGGVIIERDGSGGLLFRRRDGTAMPAAPVSPRPLRRLPLPPHRKEMPLPLSAGEPMDLDLTVLGLAARAGPPA